MSRSVAYQVQVFLGGCFQGSGLHSARLAHRIYESLFLDLLIEAVLLVIWVAKFQEPSWRVSL